MFGLTKVQSAAVAILCLVGVVVFYLYAWKPQAREAEKLSREIQRQEKELAEARTVERQLPYLERRYESLKEEVSYAHAQLPESKEIAVLIKTIAGTSDKCRVKVSLFKLERIIPQEYAGGKRYFEVPIRISLRADFHNLGIFLTRIGQLQRVINVQDLKISPRPVTPEEPEEIRADFSLVTYTF